MELALKQKKNGKKQCAFCGYKGSKGALEIHHIDGNHSNNDAGNLMVLCRLCHVEAHEKRRGRELNNVLFEREQKKFGNDKEKKIITVFMQKNIPCDEPDWWEFKQLALTKKMTDRGSKGDGQAPGFIRGDTDPLCKIMEGQR